jgi:hypothetical protein
VSAILVEEIDRRKPSNSTNSASQYPAARSTRRCVGPSGRVDSLATVIAASEDGSVSVVREVDVLGRSPNDGMMQSPNRA